MLLDQPPDALQQYLANAVYEACRAGDLKLHGFPDFGPLVQGLKEVKPEVSGHEYQVCVKRGASLVVLGSFASKWLQLDQFKDGATDLITRHNEQHNHDGDFVEEAEERTNHSNNLELKLYTHDIMMI